MQEFSMTVLDIVQNSVRAGAQNIEIELAQDTARNCQTLIVKDDGCGMSEEMARQVVDPFCTSRTTRKVGLGLPFLKMAAEMTGGEMKLESTPGKGTAVTATFTLDHIDLAPMGDMAGTISALVQTNPDIDFCYKYTRDAQSFVLDTREVKQMLDGVPVSEPAVALFIRDYVAEHMQALLEGRTPQE